MDVVVPRRNESSETEASRQPADGANTSNRATKAKRISIELHGVPAFRIRARNGVAGAFWLWNFQHGPAHFTLDFDRLWTLGFGRVAEGTSDIG